MPVHLVWSIDKSILASVLNCHDSQIETMFTIVQDSNQRGQMLKKNQKICSEHVLRADHKVTNEAF